MTSTAATVTVVTGPAGHDIGPFTAWRAAGDRLGDGLAVRVLRPGVRRADAILHTSPNPTGRPHFGTGALGGLPLWALPSAWQHPDTNLGVVLTVGNYRDVIFDLGTLDGIGMNPGHRLTLHFGDSPDGPGGRAPELPYGLLLPSAVDIGNVAVHARDAVLRSSPASGSRHVLVEAGDGQTFLDALATLRLPPWEPAIERLALWLVLDASRLLGTEARLSVDHAVRDAADLAAVETVRQGGGRMAGAMHAAMRIALVNAQVIVPGLAGLGPADVQRAETLGGAPETVVAQLGHALDTIEARTGVAVGAIHTGATDEAPLGQWIGLGLDPQ